MRTFIGTYDIADPPATLWGAEGHERLLILVKAHGWPLGVLRLTQDRARASVSRADLQRALRSQLGYGPGAGQLPPGPEAASPAALPPVSVVVCTRDRPRSLRVCLAALDCLDYPDFEVVVVDNASRTAETAAVVAETRFRYVREDRPGLDWARNCGLQAARNDIIAYIDDDARADPLWLRGVARGFATEQVAGVTGLILPMELETRAQHLFEIYGRDGMSKGFRARRWVPERLPPLSLIQVHQVGVGANMAFRRRTLQGIGGFDTALDVGTPSCGAGDLDILHRVLLAGGEIRYEPHALVWHRHRRDMTGLERQLYNNGRAFGVFLLKRWRERRVGRRQITGFVAFTWLPWLFGRLVLATLGRHRLPPRLIWAELRGAMHAPWAYVATYRHDHQLRRRYAERS
jgi:glycosyltransferase involved in cell wall biosynthesis